MAAQVVHMVAPGLDMTDVAVWWRIVKSRGVVVGALDCMGLYCWINQIVVVAGLAICDTGAGLGVENRGLYFASKGAGVDTLVIN